MLIIHIILIIFYIYEITKQESISQKILWTCMAICWFGIILKDIPIVF